MSELLKKPYKITLWEDRNRSTTINNTPAQFLEEVCIATIGSNTMDTPIRAFNPILTEELNGSKTFSFQIYYRYWDDESEEFKINPFTNLLVNERKVKLYLPDNQNDDNSGWYDFVIKQVQENSENYIFTYVCKDLFVNELGKTGYEVELATELENNMGTITELADSILEGTDWQVDETNCDTLVQRNKEALYLYQLSNGVMATNMITGQQVSIPAGKWIYVFYSCVANHETPVQFFYVASDATTYDAAKAVYQIDKDGFIINSPNYQDSLSTINPSNITQPSGYFGQKIVQTQRMKYIPEIGETCTVWSKGGQQYYCYTENEYASVSEIQDLLTNNTNFISTNCWSTNTANTVISVGTYVGSNEYVPVTNTAGKNPHNENWFKLLSDGSYIQASETTVQANTTYYINKNTFNTLTVVGGEPDISSGNLAVIQNSGLFDNRAVLSPKGFVQGEPYIFAIKTSNNDQVIGAKVWLRSSTSVAESSILNFNTELSTIPSTLNGYKVFRATVSGNSIDYQKLLSDYGNIIFRITFVNTNGNISIHIIDAKVFKERYTKDEFGQDLLIVPDLQAVENAVVKTRYNFFPITTNLSTVYGKDYLALSETRLDTSGYEKVLVNNYEKVTSITGSKSNRFNLIQNLCEAFECWAKFTIEHEDNGQIKYSTFLDDDNIYKRSYHKYVTFKEYIGDDNPVGFRYGINLKSIQRSLVSDQIASKVIVQPNTNEFAPNGSCTIQQSILNPTGENALYNFQYFINQGLLDETALNNDLYSTQNGGLGFFVRMRAFNDAARPKINELAEVGNTLNNLESKQTIYDTLLSEADRLQTEIVNELSRAGYGGVSATGTGVEYIRDLARQRDSYNSAKVYYTTLSNRNKVLLDQYRLRYNTLSDSLKTIQEQKEKLNSDFHKKYFAFIQEGTWTSSDYWDPELYYQAANMVLYTSSFPQVSYTINVLELSQIEGFEPYKFKIADKTYVEDTEFFGYDNKGRPYKEDIVISQVKQNLDDPSQNTITVQNYKTQFQDLFQRMAAASQSLQYNEGAYNRAASAVNSDGTIDSVLLQNSLEDNALIIRNARNQSVTWDDTGITISNFKNANEIVRLTSGGIVLTSDGGQTWTTGITGKGINADVITTGRLDTNRIRIFSSNMQTFEWNSKGISAFAQTNTNGVTQTDFSKFVRFDQYGLYGYNGDANWDPDVATNNVVGINKVIRDSTFSLTWKGLSINVPDTQENNTVISIGNPSSPNFTVDKYGNVWMKGDIHLSDGSIDWGSNSPNVEPLKLYSEAALDAPTGSYDSYPSTDTNGEYYIEGVTNTYAWYDNGTKQSGYAVYESDNKGLQSSYAVAKIIFSGYSTFTVKIKSDAEAGYDFTMASTINATSFPTSSSSNTCAQSTETNNNSWMTVGYSTLNTGENFIYIVFKKDGSTNSSSDAGYFYIPVTQGQRVWHKTYNSTKDNYVAYSYDNGETWTTSNTISADSDIVYKALISDKEKLGLFLDGTNGLCLNADYITTGSLDAGIIKTGTLNANNINVTNLKVGNIVDSSGNRITGTTTNTIQGSYLDLDGASGSHFSFDDYGYASIYSPTIYAATFQSTDDGNGVYSKMDANGFRIFTNNNYCKLSLSYLNDNYVYPYILIGAGTSSEATYSQGLIMKLQNGLWIGSADILSATATPSYGTYSAGIFVNFSSHSLYFRDSGTTYTVSDFLSGGGGSPTAVFG